MNYTTINNIVREDFTIAFNARIEKYYLEFTCDSSVPFNDWHESDDWFVFSEIDCGNRGCPEFCVSGVSVIGLASGLRIEY